MTVYIAKSRRTLGHFLIRLVDSERVDAMPDEEIPGFINAMTTAKTHKQLLYAVENTSVLFDTRGTDKQPSRVMSLADCKSVLKEEFEPVDAAKLAYEMYMASPRVLKANSGKESPAAEFDAFSCGFLDLDESSLENKMVVIEPVQDWMTFRNILTVGAALLANIERLPKGGRVLEASGFCQPDKSSFPFSVFVIPLKFYASGFMFEFFRHLIVSMDLTKLDMDYLFWLYNDSSEVIAHSDKGLGVRTSPLGGDRDVFVATKYMAKHKNSVGVFASIYRDLLLPSKEGDFNLYLCVRMRNGESQLDCAKKIVRALWNKTQNLLDEDGALLGMSQREEGLFLPDQESIDYTFHSLICRSWYFLCYHKGRRLIACKHCGNGVLASKRGPVKEFCSDSCRIQHVEGENG